jgi:selenium-dependent xanthine dehydrogenase
MKFKLNGIEKEYSGNPELSLLKYLREIEEITSVKDGCSPQAACGACTVIIDNQSKLSCVTPMKNIEGKSIITPEGLDEFRKRVFTNAFVEKSGVQCGFCIPGIVMQANVLIDKNPNATRNEIAQALQPNLCRCTGYKKIIDSIEYAAEAIRDLNEIPFPATTGGVGKRHPKYDADKLVLGKSPFVADVRLEGMFHGALKFSDHPRAKVLSVDTSPAETLEGVIKVFTAQDIPGERYLGLIVKDWPIMIDVGEESRYVGDVIASVVAESEEIARRAVSLISVEYEVLEPLTDMTKALDSDAPQIHPDGNLLSLTKINRGNASEAFEEAAFISEETYETQMIEHGFMEPECAVARPGDTFSVEVLSQGQGVYEDRKQICNLLNINEEKVRVILVPNGGGFGGKEDLSVQHHAALASYLLNRPVKILLTRHESILMHPKRHPMIMKYKLACDAKGILTALEADIIGDTGAYASVGMKVLERAAGHSTGAYSIPNAKVTSKAVYTNNLPCGAMRGFGVNQTAFAIENCIDNLCEQGGFDRWQIRYDNALVDGGVTATGQILRGGTGVRETLIAVKDVFQNSKYAGIACGIKNTGIGNGMPDEGIVLIEVISEDKVILNHGWTEMGQGVNTMAVQFLCEATGINPNIVEVIVDTAKEAKSGMTTASRATSIIGNAIIETAKEFKKNLVSHSLKELAGKTYKGEWVCDWTTKPGKENEEVVTHYSYSYATQVVILNDNGEIEKIVAAHDAGKVINPNLFEGQIEGALHMGLGYAISEELEMEGGRPKSTMLRKMGILRAKEMPEVEVIGVEVPDPVGPHGAKGVGEIGLVPTAGAVANAFAHYDGKRYNKLPIKLRVNKH